MNEEIVNSIFDPSEIDLVKNTPIKDRQHPLKRLLFPQDEWSNQIAVNTENALRQILFSKNGPGKLYREWKSRILDIDDYSSSSSALGEIRAFGNLLSTGLPIKRKSKFGADFSIENNNNRVLIEVFSKQSDIIESDKLDKFNNRPLVERAYNTKTSLNSDAVDRFIVDIHSTIPFGQPKNIKESITENAISKLASIKNKEHQISETETSLLWLDFQDETWNLLATPEIIFPIRTWNRGFYSGELWYAFYGWKGAPIFEGFRNDIFSSDLLFRMRHEGRFRTNTKLDAVVISLKRNTFILENPYSKKPLKKSVLERLIFLAWFNIKYSYTKYSYTKWLEPNLEQRIELEKQRIISLSNIPLLGEDDSENENI
jgi:hypothetical protein